MTGVDAEFGNAGEVDTHGTGWFVGFSDWMRNRAAGNALRHVPQHEQQSGLSIKWMLHRPGDPRGQDKPLSEGRTLSVLVSAAGCFRLQISASADFSPSHTVEHVLRRHGDFSIWGEGLHHRYVVEADSVILSVRWKPVGVDGT
jgi:hypothetical protein